MKQRVYTGKELALSFNTEVLTFNDAVLLFHQRGLTHFDVSKFTYNEIEMGAATIQFDLRVEPEIDPAFDKDWYVDFRGERYFLSSLRPPVKKDTESLKYTYSLTFKSQRADLDRYEFANFVAVSSTQQPISYDFSLPLTVQQFIARMNINLEYYFGTGVWAMVLDSTYMDNLNTAIYDGTSPVTVAFSRETLWSLLTGLYDIYGLRWRISNEAGVMTIRLGYTPVTLTHTFEYGKDKGLVSIERHNQNEKIYTRLSGRGSDRNLPYRYFDSSSAGYAEDPDNNSYTQNITYSALMPISYRQYVKGWNDHAASQPADSSTYAYTKGYTDIVFNPVDYVVSEDAEAIYGVWKGSVADATDIYPTLQGATSQTLGRLDQIVAVEPVLNDDYAGTDSSLNIVAALVKKETRTFPGDGGSTLQSDAFSVDSSYGKISLLISATIAPTQPEFNYTVNFMVYLMNGETIDASLSFSNQSTTVRYFSNYADFENVTPGTYTVKVEYYLDSNLSYNNQPNTVTFEMSDITKYPTNQYKQTFDVWVKNIWGSTYQDAGHESETPEQYMHRIWDPLLVPNKDITLMFSSGLIAGEDYEFKVARDADSSTAYYIYPDTSRSLSGVQSHWRLSLIKSDVNLESRKLMWPNMTINASAGDYMFFTNIQMPYEPYVRDAEERIESFLENELSKVDDENHGYTINPSSIFLETYAENASIGVGVMVPVADAKIVGSTAVNLGITNLTIEYSSESLLPKWTIAVADKPNTQKNSVQILQGDVKVLSSSLMSAQQLTEQITLALDSRYLRKDGQAQDSYSKTDFRDTLTTYGVVKSNEYLQGQIGGYGYCLFKNSNGDYVFEVDQLNVRKTINVNELVINQISAFGGRYIYSAAAMEVLRVDSSHADYDVCYLDVKGGTVVNQFIVGDHAYCQQFDPNSQAQSKFFWRRVSGVGLDYIQISKTGGSGVNGTPEPGDVIAQLGHDSSVGRQAALIIDQLNGGTVTQYAKIDGYTFTNKDYVSYGVDVSTGRAYERIYGDMYIGGRDPETDNYIGFDSSTGLIDFRGTIRQDSVVADSGGNAVGNLLIDRGAYSASIVYYPGNTVYNGGSTYRCILQTTPGTPTSNTTYWAISAARGEDGTSVKIIDSVDSSVNLDPSYGGEVGDGYMVNDTGHLWVWGGSAWTDVGQIKGDAGDPGTPASVIKLTATGQVILADEDDVRFGETITVTASLQNITISAWTFSMDDGVFSPTPPSGVLLNSGVVTITPSDTTFHTLSIKAANGAISDTLTVAVLHHGNSAISVILSNESHTLSCTSAGTPLSGEIAKATTTVSVYKGGSPISFSIYSVAPSTGLTASVNASTISLATISDAVSSGYIDITVRIEAVDIVKRFSISKSKQGITGGNTAIVYLYQRSASAPSLGFTNAVTYTFSSKTITSGSIGLWSQTIPSGTYPLYVVAATAYSNTDNDSIAYTEWSTPVILAENGATGAAGLNSATVYLYQRAASTPALPTAVTRYTFATGILEQWGSGTLSPWTQSIPASNGNPCYVISATAVSNTATDTILNTEWTAVRMLVSDGATGATGADGVSAVQLYSPDINVTVSPSSNAFSKQIRVRLLSGSTTLPFGAAYSYEKTLTGLTASADTNDTYDYIINLTGFDSNTTTVGYIDVTAVYNGQDFHISISVARVVNPVLVIKGAWSTGTVYYGNCNQRDAVYHSGSWYAAKITLGSTSTTWVPSEWEALNTFKNVATDTLLAANANLGGLIFKNEQLISQSGTISGSPSTNWSDANFIPNLLIDGSTGQLYARGANLQGAINASTGSIGSLDIESDGLSYSDQNGTMRIDGRRLKFDSSTANTDVRIGSAIYEGDFPIIGDQVALFGNHGSAFINKGIEVDVSSDSGYHAAIFGNGNIGFDGAVSGFGLSSVTASNIGEQWELSLVDGAYQILKTSASNTAFVLPSRSDLLQSFGLPPSSTKRFCVEITLICSGGSSPNLTVFGRTTMISWTNNSLYPYLRDNNYGNMNSGQAMGEGDVISILLTYNGSIYDAYIKSKNY